MGKKLYISLICALAIGVSAADLGKIEVESSTIEDLATNPKTEVSTVNTIDEQTITDINPKNINDLLQTVPGVTADVRSDVVEIHIRGIGQQEFMWEDTGVAVVIDGVPVLQDGGKVRGINIDEIESIKVIKGGASYLYGNTALAGAIIITTKKNKDKNGGYVSAEGGSYGFQDYKAKFYKSNEKYSFNLMGGYKNEDGYWYQTQNDQKTASGQFTYFIDDMSDITLSADYTDKYQETTRGSVTGVTEAETNPTGANDGDWAYSHDYYSDIYKYYAKYNKDFENGSNLMVNTYYYKDLYNYKSSPQDLNDDGSDDAYTRDNDDDIKQYGVKSEYKNTIGNLAYMLGVDIGTRDSTEYDETLVDYVYSSYRGTTYYYKGEKSLDETTEDRYAVYGELKYKINPKLAIIFNSRYDYDKYTDESSDHEYDGTTWSDTTSEDSETFRNISYRIGTTYDMASDSTFFANVSTGFRNPRVSQYITNTNLDPETTINYEIGFRGKMMHGLYYEASVFVMDTKDIIAKDQGTYYWTRTTVYDNVGDARNKGLEISLKSDRSKKVSFNLAYTYLDAYYTSHMPFTVALDGADPTYDITGNQLPRVPHHKLDLILNYKATPKLEIMGELYAQSKYYADETNFVRMPGYEKINLKATYRHNKNWEFYVKVDNVLDNQYYRTVFLFSDRNDDGVLDAEDASITVDPGRVFYAGFKYKF